MGPLAHLPALDVMWVSFYCIGFMIISVGLIYLARNKVSNGFTYNRKFNCIHTIWARHILMVLIVATWP